MADKQAACRLCGEVATWVSRQRLLDKYEVDYFLCAGCDMLQTERPYWLDEAYKQPMSRLDTGAIQRNRLAAQLTAIIATVLDISPSAACLDFGGGHGVFVRMVRDLGLDFRWFDKYADNVFARGFEGDVGARHELVTAFEALEHLANPRDDLDQLFGARPSFVLVGTLLHEGHREGWWYYMLETGQHIAFYSRRTLAWIADRFGYDLVPGCEYSLFLTRHRIGALRRALLRQILRRPGAIDLLPATVLRRIGPYRSRVEADHQAMRMKGRS
jgi:hypothetical protein